MDNLESAFMHIEVIPAALDQQPILANLLELYVYDFSEFNELELGPDGRFGYKYLPLYWEEPGRHPFLVRIDGRWAGFVLVKRGSEVSGDLNVWDMAEFFIVRRYRRRGVGMDVAQQVWSRFTGPWEVRVLETNHSAELFWRRAVAGFIGEAILPVRVEKDGRCWHLFAFEAITSEAVATWPSPIR